MTSTTEKECAQCSKPASTICTGCKDDPENLVKPTYYCSPACQKSHWLVHKKDTCKAVQERKQLYSICGILQKIFYMYKEHLFDTPVIRVEEKNGVLYNYDELEHPDIVRYIDHLCRFPSEMCRNERDRHTLLAHAACDDAVIWMGELVAYVFSGIVTSITEWFINQKGARRRSVRVLETGEHQYLHIGHRLIQLTLKNGKSYALDMSSAQYGYYEPIVPWNHYWNHRIINMPQNRPWKQGTAKEILARIGLCEAAVGRTYRVNSYVMGCLKDGAQAWEKMKDLKICNMGKLGRDSLEEEEKSLLAFIEERIQSTLEIARNSPEIHIDRL